MFVVSKLKKRFEKLNKFYLIDGSFGELIPNACLREQSPSLAFYIYSHILNIYVHM